MNRFILAALVAVSGVAALAAPAQARVSVGIGIGGGYGGWGCCGYAPYYSPYYSGYPAYYAPPAYYVAPAPTVIYQQPAPPPVTYVQPSPQPQYQQQQYEAAPPATQTSTTYVDSQGRTCRQFKSTLEDGAPVNGTACLQPDGSWRTVN